MLEITLQKDALWCQQWHVSDGSQTIPIAQTERVEEKAVSSWKNEPVRLV